MAQSYRKVVPFLVRHSRGGYAGPLSPTCPSSFRSFAFHLHPFPGRASNRFPIRDVPSNNLRFTLILCAMFSNVKPQCPSNTAVQAVTKKEIKRRIRTFYALFPSLYFAIISQSGFIGTVFRKPPKPLISTVLFHRCIVGMNPCAPEGLRPLFAQRR